MQQRSGISAMLWTENLYQRTHVDAIKQGFTDLRALLENFEIFEDLGIDFHFVYITDRILSEEIELDPSGRSESDVLE